MNEINNLINRITELERIVANRAQQQISYPLDDISKQILNEKLASVVASSKSPTSENQAVDEAGAASYNVLKAPDAFVQVTVNGTLYYIPVFT